jgi:hypothetical protein
LKLLFVCWEFRTTSGIDPEIHRPFMSIQRFISGSSIILAAWLGATFLNEVPAQRYPKRVAKKLATPAQKPLPPQSAISEIHKNLAVSTSR